jgi:cysteine-rich repeat protein
MKFVVKDDVGYRKPVPSKLVKPIVALKESDATMTRELVLLRTQQDVCGNGMWTINGKDWHDITEDPHLGTREIWKFVNRSGVTHPMHLHMLFFQVLDRQKLKLEGDKLIAQGEPQPANRSERGWKDTVQVGPFEAVRVIASFEDYEGTYPYHCHLLEHEDHGMMRQFTARAVCGDMAVAKGFEECDDGNVTDGDGCSSKCRNDTGAARTERSERPETAGEAATMSGGSTATPDAAVVADWRAPRTADSACSVQSAGARSHAQHWVWWLGLLVLQTLNRARAARKPLRLTDLDA